MCITCMQVPTKVKNDVGSPQAQNVDDCELPDKGLGTELRFSGRKQVPLATESALWHQPEWFLLTQPLNFLICDPAVDMVYMYFCITIFSCISFFNYLLDVIHKRKTT